MKPIDQPKVYFHPNSIKERLFIWNSFFLLQTDKTSTVDLFYSSKVQENFNDLKMGQMPLHQ